jgi:2-oxo-3-hexenedioate decarboxylase
MTGPASDPAIERIAGAAMAALGQSGRQIAPFTSHDPAFGLDRAYRVTPVVRRLREARGERVVGRKIGFTNRTIWAQYGVYAPIWGYVYDSTLCDLAALDGPVPLAAFAEPRIEPEIVFGLSSAPRAGMDEAALLSCVGWVAHGFEVVQSIFPDWVFAPADTVAAFGLHGALYIGERHPVAENRDEWLRTLSDFSATLRCGDVIEHGHARDVLDGPLSALKHLVDLLDRDAHNPPLAASEIVTTGTMTRAMPVKAGERWRTELAGIPLEGIAIAFC